MTFWPLIIILSAWPDSKLSTSSPNSNWQLPCWDKIQNLWSILFIIFNCGQCCCSSDSYSNWNTGACYFFIIHVWAKNEGTRTPKFWIPFLRSTLHRTLWYWHFRFWDFCIFMTTNILKVLCQCIFVVGDFIVSRL